MPRGQCRNPVRCSDCGGPRRPGNRGVYCQRCYPKHKCVSCSTVSVRRLNGTMCRACADAVRSARAVYDSLTPVCQVTPPNMPIRILIYQIAVEELLPLGSKYLIPAGEVDVIEARRSETQRTASSRRRPRVRPENE